MTLSKNLLPALIVTLLLVPIFCQDCESSPTADRLSSGTHTFQLNPYNSRTQCFTSPLHSFFHNLQPQITAGISNINNFVLDSLGIDFSLRALLTSSNSQASFTLFVNNGSWVSVSIFYLVSARNDFLLGSFLSSADQLATCTKQQPYMLPIALPPTEIQAYQSTATLVFLNGIRTSSIGFNLQFNQPIYDRYLRQINLTVITNATAAIELMHFGYLLVDLGLLETSGYSYSFSLSPVQGHFVTSGIVGMNTTAPNSGKIQYAYFGINRTNSLTCIGFVCAGCLSIADCQFMGGQPIGSECIKCQNGQVQIPDFGCACPPGQYLINTQCGKCQPGTNYNSTTKTCIKICGINSILSGSSCICSPGFFNISGTCSTCPPGTVYNPSANSCTTICQQNQQWRNGQCVCISGFSMINNQCQQTTATCGTNMYLYNGICKCLPHLLQYQNACYQCPANSVVTVDQKGCMCIQGFVLSTNHACVPASSVQNSQLQNGRTASGSSSLSSSTTSTSTSNTHTRSAPTTIGGRTQSGSTSGSSGAGNIYGGSSTIYTQTSNTHPSGSNSGASSSSTSGHSSGLSSGLTSGSYSGSFSGSGSTADSNCPPNAYNINGVCRPYSRISSNQSVLILNAVYVNIKVSNLPQNITNNNCPHCHNLITPSLLTNPPNVQVNLNFIPSTTHQWVAAVIYSQNLFNVTLQLRFNSAYAAFFTQHEMGSVHSVHLHPANIPKYTLPTHTLATLSKTVEEDRLDGNNEDPSSVPPGVLDYFKNNLKATKEPQV